MPTQDHTARYNLVTQVSERALARILRELYANEAFQTQFSDQLSKEVARYGMRLKFDYSAALGVPSLRLDTTAMGGVRIDAAVSGELGFGVAIDARDPRPAESHRISIEYAASFGLVARLELVGSPVASHLEITLFDLLDLDLQVDFDVPDDNQELFRRLLKRLLIVAMRSKVVRIPVSHVFNLALAAGWEVSNTTLRVINGPNPPDYDNVTIGLNTWPNRGQGRPILLHDWVNPAQDFGVAMDQRFVVQALRRAWQEDRSIPRRFDDTGNPDAAGENELRDVAFDFDEDRVVLTVRAATRQIPVDFRGKFRLDVDNGNLSVHLFDVQVSVPAWVHIFGFLAMNVAWIIVVVLMNEFFGGLIQQTANTSLREFISANNVRLSFEGGIPGTRMRIEATAMELKVRPNEVFTRGKIAVTVD